MKTKEIIHLLPFVLFFSRKNSSCLSLCRFPFTLRAAAASRSVAEYRKGPSIPPSFLLLLSPSTHSRLTTAAADDPGGVLRRGSREEQMSAFTAAALSDSVSRPQRPNVNMRRAGGGRNCEGGAAAGSRALGSAAEWLLSQKLFALGVHFDVSLLFIQRREKKKSCAQSGLEFRAPGNHKRGGRNRQRSSSIDRLTSEDTDTLG